MRELRQKVYEARPALRDSRTDYLMRFLAILGQGERLAGSEQLAA